LLSKSELKRVNNTTSWKGRGVLSTRDVVLLDLNLPRRTGLEVLTRIRESLVCATVPVIIVTSSRAPNDREAAQRLQATRYFQKPSNYDDFMRLGEIVKEIVGADRVR
jgi:CheY-like chemotaxis protein